MENFIKELKFFKLYKIYNKNKCIFFSVKMYYFLKLFVNMELDLKENMLK